MKNSLIIAVFIGNSTVLLSAQTSASLGEVQHPELEISNAMNLLKQNILLILSTCLSFFAVVRITNNP